MAATQEVPLNAKAGLIGAVTACVLLGTHLLLVVRRAPPPLLDALARKFAVVQLPIPRQLPILLAIVCFTSLAMATCRAAPPRWQRLRAGAHTLFLGGSAALGLAPARSLGVAAQVFEVAIVVASVVLVGARAWGARRAGARSTRGALVRWLAVYAAGAVVAFVYLGYPALRLPNYVEWRASLGLAVVIGLVLGLPAALVAGAPRPAGPADLALGVIVFCRAVGRAALNSDPLRLTRAVRRNAVHAAILQVVLLWGVFAPLAVHVVAQEHAAAAAHALRVDLTSWSAVQSLALHGLRLLEATLASAALVFGAFTPGSRPRSLDRTAGGWIVTLLFFYPFDFGTHALLPLPRNPGGTALAALAGQWAHHFAAAIGLVLVVLVVSAVVALGPRFAYGSHRGVVRSGPYAWIRHPAYAGEYLLRWVELGPAIASVWHVVGLIGLGVLYHLRALTEERHLGRDPEYVAYARAVRYRYIPRLW